MISAAIESRRFRCLPRSLAWGRVHARLARSACHVGGSALARRASSRGRGRRAHGAGEADFRAGGRRSWRRPPCSRRRGLRRALSRRSNNSGLWNARTVSPREPARTHEERFLGRRVPDFIGDSRTEGRTEATISGDTRADWSEAFELVPSLQIAYVWHASVFTREVLDGFLRIGFLYP